MAKHENIYSAQFRTDGNCLWEVRSNKGGTYERKLCNFLPWITKQITQCDGISIHTRIVLSGIHASGRTLPEVEISSEEFPAFNWISESWGFDCILEVGSNVKDTLRYAIQTTASHAESQIVYSVTGWRKIEGQWHFLMPGNDQITVTLPHKLSGYELPRVEIQNGILTTAQFFRIPPASEEVTYPLLALVFLSPLNHFLKQVGYEPKFIVALFGKTGSRKSTLAALMLSFFGKFTAAELPLSFRDTANSIIHNTFALKDVLTCIDDFYPAGKQEERTLTATAQTILRSYGDRQGRGRLSKDSSPMESRPPQGNAIITAEFPPEVGQSGTARYFPMEIEPNTVDLKTLSLFQEAANAGELQGCMAAYIDWIRRRYLSSEDAEKHLGVELRSLFLAFRTSFSEENASCHGRIPENAAWLELGMYYLLQFLLDNNMFSYEEHIKIQEQFHNILLRLSMRQTKNIIMDRPTHVFIRKLFSLLDSGQATVSPKDGQYNYPNSIGYEDEDFFYLYSEKTHQMVKKVCEDQGEHFSITSRALLKVLAEEGLIEPEGNQNTKSIRFGSRTKRVVCLYKSKAKHIADTSG